MTENLDENNSLGSDSKNIENIDVRTEKMFVDISRYQRNPVIESFEAGLKMIPSIFSEFTLHTPIGYFVFENPYFLRPSKDSSLSSLTTKFKDESIFIPEGGKKIFPAHIHRERGEYSSSVFVDLVFYPYDLTKYETRREKMYIGKYPAMVLSSLCNLSDLSPEEMIDVGASPNDPGGYFIYRNDKIIYSQQGLLPNKMLITLNKKEKKPMVYIIHETSPVTSFKISIYLDNKDILRVILPDFDPKKNVNLNVLHLFSLSKKYSGVKNIQTLLENLSRKSWESLRFLQNTILEFEQQGDSFSLFPSIFKENEIKKTWTNEEIRENVLLKLFPVYTLEIQKLEKQIISIFWDIYDLIKNKDLKFKLLSFLRTNLPISEFFKEERTEILKSENSDEDFEEEVEYKILPSLYQQIVKKEKGKRLSKKYSKIDFLRKQIEYQNDYRFVLLGEMILNLISAYNENRFDNLQSWKNKSVQTSNDALLRLLGQMIRNEFRKVGASLKDETILKNEKIFEQVRDKFNVFLNFTEPITSGNWNVGTNRLRENSGIVNNLITISDLGKMAETAIMNKNTTREGIMIENRTWNPDGIDCIDPLTTPEGKACGLRESKTQLSIFSLYRDEKKEIFPFLYQNEDLFSNVKYQSDFHPVYINGRIVGWGNTNELHDLFLQKRRSGQISFDISLSVSNSRLFIYTLNHRILAPYFRVEDNEILIEKDNAWDMSIPELISNGYIEYLDTIEKSQRGRHEIFLAVTKKDLEQKKIEKSVLLSNIQKIEEFIEDLEFELQDDPNNIDIQQNLEKQKKILEGNKDALKKFESLQSYSHMSIHPMEMLGFLSTYIPEANKNPAARSTYSTKMMVHIPGDNPSAAEHFQTSDIQAKFVQIPIAQTSTQKLYRVELSPQGNIVEVAILAYNGMTEEDSFALNLASAESGFGVSSKLFTYNTTLQPPKGGSEIYGMEDLFIPESEKYRYHAIDPKTGIARIGSNVQEGDALIVKYQIDEKRKVKNRTIFLKPGENGRVLSVFGPQRGVGSGIVNMIIEDYRPPVEGSKKKVGPQKGTTSTLVKLVDLPFDEDTGEVPALIMNPHAFPTRMTISVLYEMLKTTVGSIQGKFINANPFQDTDPKELYAVLEGFGFRKFGKRRMRSGIDGSPIQSDVFMLLTHVNPLAQDPRSKIQFASTRMFYDTITLQASSSMDASGNARIGEMEREAIVGSGAAGVLQDALLVRKDQFRGYFCGKCNNLAQADPTEECFVCKTCNETSTVLSGKIPAALPYSQHLFNVAWQTIEPKVVPKEKFSSFIESSKKSSKKKQTGPYMTDFERIRLLAARASHIQNGAPPRVDPKGIWNPYKIAEMELKARKIPLQIVRNLPGGKKEIWDLSEFERV